MNSCLRGSAHPKVNSISFYCDELQRIYIHIIFFFYLIPIRDNRNPTELFLIDTHSPWPCCPASCAERWASSNCGAVLWRKGRRSWEPGESPQPLPRPERKLRPENNMRNLCKQPSRGKETREEAGEQWRNGRDTTHPAQVWVGTQKSAVPESEPNFLKLIDKNTRPSSHSDLSHAAAHIVYLYFSCRNCFPSDLYPVCLCFLIFVDVPRLLFCWTRSPLFSGLSTAERYE